MATDSYLERMQQPVPRCFQGLHRDNLIALQMASEMNLIQMIESPV